MYIYIYICIYVFIYIEFIYIFHVYNTIDWLYGPQCRPHWSKLSSLCDTRENAHFSCPSSMFCGIVMDNSLWKPFVDMLCKTNIYASCTHTQHNVIWWLLTLPAWRSLLSLLLCGFRSRWHRSQRFGHLLGRGSQRFGHLLGRGLDKRHLLLILYYNILYYRIL